nr:RHS repeat-associated core domain-containing protein [uncultured Pseudomonas sp.]
MGNLMRTIVALLPGVVTRMLQTANMGPRNWFCKPNIEEEPLAQTKSHQNSNRRTYHYCQGRITNELGSESSQTVAQYGSQLLALQFRQAGMCTCSLLTVDQHRSVLHRDDQRQSQHSLVYTPYGYSSQHPEWLGFNGEWPDLMTRHYLLGNGHRGFNPVLMRFNSPDGMSPFGRGGLNAYSYCQQDPINYEDPNGNFRVGRFISRLAGRVTGNTRSKSISSALHTSVTPVLVAPIKPFGKKNGAGKFFSNSKETKMTMKQVLGRDEAEGYDFLGYHGSGEGQKMSLEAGVDIKRNIHHAYRPGFYFSENIKQAREYAAWKYETEGYVYGVYGKRSELKGKLDRYYEGEIMVAREEGLRHLLVRDFIRST